MTGKSSAFIALNVLMLFQMFSGVSFKSTTNSKFIFSLIPLSGEFANRSNCLVPNA
jgi:hypothetical protein